MMRPDAPFHRFRDRACRALAAILLLSLSGCMGWLHPVSPAPEYRAPPPLPYACQHHVHIFFVTGLDPFDYANLQGIADYCHTLGYDNTYVGQMWDTDKFETEIRRIYHDDTDAHFVLIGFSFGANCVRNIANSLCHGGNIPVDLLIYLGGNTLEDLPETRPENVGKVFNILGVGCIWNGCSMTGAENHHLGDVWHFGTPTHNVTLGALACELTEIAARVPFIEPVLVQPPEQLPVTPRPLNPRPPGPADEWDFLKPAQHLSPLEP